MKREMLGFCVVAGLLLTSLVVLGQADLTAFPLGRTTMVYTVTSEETSDPLILEFFVVSLGDDRYTLSMRSEQTGTSDELSGFGFIFGAASVSSGSGESVDYSSLQALMDQRDRLQEGQDYLLPGGVEFTDIVGTTIAGVWCLEGSYVDPRDNATRVTVAFALSDPTYISPRIRTEALRGGQWVETFSIELTQYTVEGGGS